MTEPADDATLTTAEERQAADAYARQQTGTQLEPPYTTPDDYPPRRPGHGQPPRRGPVPTHRPDEDPP
jgi:hypothetical protein